MDRWTAFPDSHLRCGLGTVTSEAWPLLCPPWPSASLGQSLCPPACEVAVVTPIPDAVEKEI